MVFATGDAGHFPTGLLRGPKPHFPLGKESNYGIGYSLADWPDVLIDWGAAGDLRPGDRLRCRNVQTLSRYQCQLVLGPVAAGLWPQHVNAGLARCAEGQADSNSGAAE